MKITKPIRLEQYNFRSWFLVLYTTILLILNYTNCTEHTENSANENELSAYIIRTPGDTIHFISRGDSTFFGCSILGTDIEGISDNNAFLSLSILASPSGCISKEGDYSFLCKYFKDRSNPGAAIFSNYQTGGAGKANATFTKVEGHLIEGNFHVVCLCEFQTSCTYGKDSVSIQGTFKADNF